MDVAEPRSLLIGTRDGVLRWPDHSLLEGFPVWGLAVAADGALLAGGWDDAGLWRHVAGRAEKVLDGSFRLFATDPQDPDHVLAGALPVDVWSSRDAGRSWERLESLHRAAHFPDDHYVRGLAFSPAEPEVVYAGVEGLGSGGVLRSDDGGATWRATALRRDIHGLVCPGPPGHVHASSGYGFFSSEDGGDTWELRTTGLEQSYPMALAKSEAGDLYLGVAEDPPPFWSERRSGAEAALYRSSDGGKRWSRVIPPAAAAINAIATDGDSVFAGRADGTLCAGSGAYFGVLGTVPEGILSVQVGF